MSFVIYDSAGNELNSKSVRQLMSDLNNIGEIDLIVYNDARTTTPGIYLLPSSDMGEVDYPSLNSPYTDFNDMLLLGEQGFGLSVIKGEEEEIFFSFQNGASSLNKINLPQLADLEAGSQTPIKIKFRRREYTPTRRFYIGVEINDS